MTDKDKDIRKEVIRLLERATPENRRAVINLLPAAKRALEMGFVPEVKKSTLHSWRCLLVMLSGIASMQMDPELLVHVSTKLLAVADHMVPPADALRESAEVLVNAFHADLYVCRVRDKEGNWCISSASCSMGDTVPMFSAHLEERLLLHPVMRAIADGHDRYIVSNNLHSLDRGGEATDCIAYKEGYRTRLAFVIREHSGEPPFGLIMLYSHQDFAFEHYDDKFLARCASLVNLSVGHRVSLARDTIEKAAGAMAHYGNNALNVMRAQAEYANEVAEDLDEDLGHARSLAEEISSALPADSPLKGKAQALAVLLGSVHPENITDITSGIVDGTARMTSIISSLKKSANTPRLMKYVPGMSVLKLEDGRSMESEDGGESRA